MPLHNGKFDFDESVLLTGVELYRRILGLCE
jgi:metal-dependent amidase/aminoacylase/carboxypeptidase family protein